MSGPVIILVETQLSQNIGSTARAMLNFGLKELRLIKPFANPLANEARALAAGADEILDSVKIFQDTREAIADLHHVYATTARPRDMTGLHMSPRQAGDLMQKHSQEGLSFGVMFGPERSGLTNEDIALCSGTITVPLNPLFSSLNLAQSVLLIAYEYYQAQAKIPEDSIFLKQGESLLATKEELLGLFGHLETELDKAGYFRTTHKKPKMVQTIHTMFSRVPFTAQEVCTFRGIISDLVNPHGIYSRTPKNKQN